MRIFKKKKAKIKPNKNNIRINFYADKKIKVGSEVKYIRGIKKERFIVVNIDEDFIVMLNQNGRPEYTYIDMIASTGYYYPQIKLIFMKLKKDY